MYILFRNYLYAIRRPINKIQKLTLGIYHLLGYIFYLLKRKKLFLAKIWCLRGALVLKRMVLKRSNPCFNFWQNIISNEIWTKYYFRRFRQILFWKFLDKILFGQNTVWTKYYLDKIHMSRLEELVSTPISRSSALTAVSNLIFRSSTLNAALRAAGVAGLHSYFLEIRPWLTLHCLWLNKCFVTLLAVTSVQFQPFWVI